MPHNTISHVFVAFPSDPLYGHVVDRLPVVLVHAPGTSDAQHRRPSSMPAAFHSPTSDAKHRYGFLAFLALCIITSIILIVLHRPASLCRQPCQFGFKPLLRIQINFDIFQCICFNLRVFASICLNFDQYGQYNQFQTILNQC